MLPVIASVNSFNYQTPLVNTTTPGTNVVHVPYDNVAPSVSSAQVDNNTTSNNSIVSTPAQEQQAIAAAPDTTQEQESSPSFSSFVQGGGSGGSSGGVQSTFVAQLAAQDSSPQTQVILVQYEKLVATHNVKYKPSEALKPQDEELSSVFGRILNESAAAPAAPPKTQTAQPNTQPHTDNNAQITIEAAPLLPAAPRSGKAQNTSTDETASTDSTVSADTTDTTTPPGFDAIPPHVIDAYASTASRVGSFDTKATELA